MMESKEILQKPLFIIEENVTLKPIILGDSAYSIKPWLFTPYARLTNMSPGQRRFNYEHCKGREVVERGYGHLKGRFQILRTESNEHLERVHLTVMVCIVLHNICILYDDDTEIPDEDNDDDSDNDENDEDDGDDTDDLLTGEFLRDVVMDNLNIL